MKGVVFCLAALAWLYPLLGLQSSILALKLIACKQELASLLKIHCKFLNMQRYCLYLTSGLLSYGNEKKRWLVACAQAISNEKPQFASKKMRM